MSEYNDRPAPLPAKRQTLRKLAGADMPFWLILWLMILLVAGTIAQRQIGLYEAERLFFSSWVIWLGPVPLPGGFPTLSVLAVLLTIKFLFFSPWSWGKAGIILSHFGVLVLLIGGLVTVITSSEGYMPIPEKSKGERVFDYHLRELSVLRNGEPFFTKNFRDLNSGPVSGVSIPFKINIEKKLINARTIPRTPDTAAPGDIYRGIAKQITFMESTPDKADEANHNALKIRISGVSGEQDGIYLLSENIAEIPSFTLNGEKYEIRLERSSRILSFSIYLDDIIRNNHPGMDMAKDYMSKIVIHDNGMTWPVIIRMNEPLRYRGNTFYQSSYIMDGSGAETSVLAVVRNRGAIFPYIASVLISLGLLLHMIIMSRRKFLERPE